MKKLHVEGAQEESLVAAHAVCLALMGRDKAISLFDVKQMQFKYTPSPDQEHAFRLDL